MLFRSPEAIPTRLRQLQNPDTHEVVDGIGRHSRLSQNDRSMQPSAAERDLSRVPCSRVLSDTDNPSTTCGDKTLSEALHEPSQPCNSPLLNEKFMLYDILSCDLG